MANGDRPLSSAMACRSQLVPLPTRQQQGCDREARFRLSILCKGVRDRTQREKSLVCSAGRLAYFIASSCGFQGWLGVLSRQARQGSSVTCRANAGPGSESLKLPATSHPLGDLPTKDT